MQPIYPSFSSHATRRQPLVFGSAALVALVGQLFIVWANGGPFDAEKISLFSLAFGLIVSGLSVCALGYTFRRGEKIPSRSAETRKIFLFSVVWSFVVSAVGFFLLSCSFGTSCMAWSNAQTAVTISLVLSAFMSLMILSN
jgi:hypothetical protein